jgi:hypothetical protein
MRFGCVFSKRGAAGTLKIWQETGMTWITSAPTGKFFAGRNRWPFKVLLLIAHLGLLVGVLHERAAAPVPSERQYAAIDAMTARPLSGGIALLALGTGLLLAVLMLTGSGRPRVRPDSARTALHLPRTLPAPSAPDPDGGEALHCSMMARLNHDLRTPLNALIGFADLMHAETFGPLGHERYRAYADHMRSCGHDLLRATESTLAMTELLSAPTLGGHRTVDLGTIASDAWAASRLTGDLPGSSVRLVMPDGLRIRADMPALRQALVNLFGAAAARSSNGDCIEFGARACYGRVQAWITVVRRAGGPTAATTGCRPPTSTSPAIDDLNLSVSRRLLGLQGIPMVIATDSQSAWTVTFSLEDATQSDFFDQRPMTAAPEQADHSAVFLGAPSPSPSRSA